MTKSAMIMLFAAVACGAFAQQKTTDESSKKYLVEFNSLVEQWKNAYNSKDAKNLIPFYAEHSQYISAHVEGYIADGRDQVIANFQRGMTGGGHIDSIKILSIDSSESTMTVVSRYDATNSGVRVNGRNLIVWKMIDGRWQITRHMTVVRD